jgi:ABC-2 type transport system permease protein
MKFLAVLKKEILLLIRDIPALSLMFLLPTVLVIVITYTQEKTLKSIEKKETRIAVLFIDNDKSILSNTIQKGLKSSGFFDVINVNANENIKNEDEAKENIKKGKYQAAISIPFGTAEQTRNFVGKNLGTSSENTKYSDSFKFDSKTKAEIKIYFDPAISESYKVSIISSLNRFVQAAEIKIASSVISSNIKEQVKRQVQDNIEKYLSEELRTSFPNSPFREQINKYLKQKLSAVTKQEIDFSLPVLDFENNSPINIREIFEQGNTSEILPPPVQNNIPTFGVFAIFFIAIPLAGSLITEKTSSTFYRIKTLPISYLTLLGGKIFVYLLVCIIQFAFIIFVGITLMPVLFGFNPFQLGTRYLEIFLILISSSLGAIGFALIVATIAKTHAQSGIFGSLITVILGIISGMIIPVFMMPPVLKTISSFSPMRWGIESFLDVFIRGALLSDILCNIIKLFIFFLVGLLLSLSIFVRKK